jgi:hypothetical protein
MRSHWWNGLVICVGLVGCAASPSPSGAPRVQGSVVGATPAGATCGPGQRLCVRCNGSGTFCAPRCPECAPLLTPAADALALDRSDARCPGLM